MVTTEPKSNHEENLMRTAALITVNLLMYPIVGVWILIAMVMCGVWTSTCTDSEETRQTFILLLGTAIGVGNAAWSVYWFIRAVVWLFRRQTARMSSNCVSCGRDVNEDAKSCVRCGEAMHGPTPSAARPESASSAPGDGVKKGYFVQGLKEYANVGGRASREEFWWFTLFLFGINFLINVVGVVVVIFLAVGGVSVDVLFSFYRVTSLGLILVTALLLLAVTTRRLHDTGRSGWWLLVILVPLIGWVVLLIFLLLPSDPGPNKYGRGPGS